MDTRTLNSITGRLSLRAPQRESLEALAKAIDATDERLLDHKHDVPALLDTLKAEFTTLEDFEREFPSLCFALATGVGKTRLMGAFIAYLYQAFGIRNFFVLAPNLTIYNKLIADFSPDSAKYVFKGIAEFANYPPEVITGDNYQQRGAQYMDDMFGNVTINVFNISKINSEVRGGKAPKIKRLSEYIGDSYFNHLAKLPDLVLLMDESHRYRASAGVKAINELKPIFGLELTATPFVEKKGGSGKPAPFKNVIVDYPLARAMDDGFVKEPAVVTQRNFDASQHSKDQLETIKLMDGIRLHEATKVELLTYANVNEVKVVKPFMLVIARDTTHASELLTKLEDVFDERYKGKVIQVDSSKSGAAEDEMIARLLAVESVEEKTEIVIHVNMLKEGWDVTNLYTIVPLRAANARTLIEQSIGRGLRLPYGKRTGVEAVDRLSIVAHDKFQEIVDAANDPENPLRLKQLILERPEDEQAKESVIVGSNVENLISGNTPVGSAGTTYNSSTASVPQFDGVAEKTIAQVTLDVIKQFQHKPSQAPTSSSLLDAELQEKITKAVTEQLSNVQQTLIDEQGNVNVGKVIEKATELVVNNTIDIPRVIVTPKGEVSNGYRPFTLDVSGLKFNPQDRELVSQSLQTNQQTEIGEGDTGNYEPIKENYILKKLFNYDDISYDEHAEILHDLSQQVVEHLKGYLQDDKDVENVLQNQSDAIAKNIHSQMDKHFYEDATEYEVEVRSGFTTLKGCSYTATKGQDIHSFRDTVKEVAKIKQMLFGNFAKCLYPIVKFDSDTERRFSVIVERDAEKWFKPAKGQFKMYYKMGTEHPEYVPDFVAETSNAVYMIETKSTQHRNEDGSWNEEVTEKAKSGAKWCENASQYLQKNSGKEWKYLLIPHDEVKEHNTLSSFASKFEKTSVDF
ncbi:DEAD/DEAH box helicase [Thalassotalea atypica]|uniref:DEAD/DEAH box helicase n=1 Tax=Thalassotalea atypica TaxID=2054316 RepID=UPI0025738082|nr:DEAD/DEAH box helicase family protein [Thalassotalea atypica]